jgi:putative sigma-54 modulation protein
MDLCVHKIEHQLRRYKERVQKHRGETSAGEIPRLASDVAEPPGSSPPAID